MRNVEVPSLLVYAKIRRGEKGFRIGELTVYKLGLEKRTVRARM
jgi:hypothetical protein